LSRPTDRDFDALLRRGLDAGTTAPPGDHASADVLAAWSEGSLDAPETRRWEEHFSRCETCLDALAALARIHDADPAPLPWWRQLALPSFPVARWAVAGATAVLALSVAIRLAPEAERRVAEELAAPAKRGAKTADEMRSAARAPDRNEAPPPAAREADSAFADLRERDAPPAPAGDKKESAGAPEVGSRKIDPAARTGAPDGQQAELARRFEAEPAPRADEAAKGAHRAEEPSATAQRSQEPVAGEAPAKRDGEPQPAAPAAEAQPAWLPETAAIRPPGETDRAGREQGAAGGMKSADDMGETSYRLEGERELAPRTKEASPRQFGGLFSRTEESPRQILIASPERTHLWRIGDGGTIEHSTGGESWTPQASGVEADLLGGMAPMERVCWVVGREGTILRTIDAETWQQIPAPTRADLVHVSAMDAYHATVTSTAGDSFRTEDGGLHWRVLPKPTPTP
jgi:hypothetical protein